KYREQVKPFEHAAELKKVQGIGRVTFNKMRPYITTGSGLELSKLLYSDYRYWTHNGHFQAFTRYQTDMQRARGYKQTLENDGYAGGPVKYYQRFGYRSNHLS